MRAIFNFFTPLLFLLLGGVEYAHAASHYQKGHHNANFHSAKPQFIKLSNSTQEHAVIKNTRQSEEGEYAIDVDDKDEDENSSFGRRYVLLISMFFGLSYAFLLIYLYNRVKGRLPFCAHLSYTGSNKYLTQRVLRI